LQIHNVHILQVGDFLTKAGQVFREVTHNSSIRLQPIPVWLSSDCCKCTG
jgi:hypothetical protein